MRVLILCLLSFLAGQCTQEAAIDLGSDRTQDYRDHFGPVESSPSNEFYGVEF